MSPCRPLPTLARAFALWAAIAAGCSAPHGAQHAPEAADGAAPQPVAAARERNAGLDDLLEDAALEIRRAAPPGFAVRVVRPFVVVSDETSEVAERRIGRVVVPAIDWLERSFFRTGPKSAIAIWICADSGSYERTARSLTGGEPSTPFGFYSAERGAIVLDASTGDGTLVHELVHPFVHADFPACPTWLDEGLGSLYERCVFEGGSLRGLVNWRLAALQRAAAEDRVPAVAELVRMTPESFYGDGSELNYAAARYLCLYLQERGALTELYRRLRDFDASSADPAADAERALADLLGVRDMGKLDAGFRAWVTKLKAGSS